MTTETYIAEIVACLAHRRCWKADGTPYTYDDVAAAALSHLIDHSWDWCDLRALRATDNAEYEVVGYDTDNHPVCARYDAANPRPVPQMTMWQRFVANLARRAGVRVKRRDQCPGEATDEQRNVVAGCAALVLAVVSGYIKEHWRVKL